MKHGVCQNAMATSRVTLARKVQSSAVSRKCDVDGIFRKFKDPYYWSFRNRTSPSMTDGSPKHLKRCIKLSITNAQVSCQHVPFLHDSERSHVTKVCVEALTLKK
ncbi:hypothetical protein TNCV_4434021 [Trichonephila clavipes]|nr:hypothetical protein TNCV_4434021 [Trichonephila clavipes]